MHTAISSVPVTAHSRRLWAGRIIAGLLSALLLLDAVMKLLRPAAVLESFVRTGWPATLALPLGVVLLLSTALYILPRTAILGAILLTGYLGGAVAANVRLQFPLFSYTLVPVYCGVLLWGALWLREPRLAALIPLRANQQTGPK